MVVSVDNTWIHVYDLCMHTDTLSKQKKNVRVSGVSFQPETWEYLNAEVERQGHRNRSLVIEKALDLYQDVQEGRVKIVKVSHQGNGVSA